MRDFSGEHFRAVLFDHDDTLVGTIDSKWDQHKHIARTYYGKELQDDEIRAHWGIPLHDLVCILYGTEDVEQALEYNKQHIDDYPKIAFPGSVDALRQVRATGSLVGIITATHRFSFEHDLVINGIPLDGLDYTQTADETPAHKPDPAVFDPTLEWLTSQGVKPAEVLYVGDGLHDMKAALGAGFEFLGVETGLVNARAFAEAGATSKPSVAELGNVLGWE